MYHHMNHVSPRQRRIRARRRKQSAWLVKNNRAIFESLQAKVIERREEAHLAAKLFDYDTRAALCISSGNRQMAVRVGHTRPFSGGRPEDVAEKMVLALLKWQRKYGVEPRA